jgi:hypothetical protein
VVAARGLAIVLATLAFVTGPGTHPARADARPVTARDGRLTVKIEAMPADQLLAEIARQTGIQITPTPAGPERLVTASFEDLEIETALARVLTNCDYVLVFRPAADAEGRAALALSEVRLFPTDARTAAPTRTAEPGPSGEGSADRTLAAGLADEDFCGRLAALTSGVSVPADVLVERATHDASAAVRAEAISQLPRNDPRAAAVAHAALADPDATVRDAARALMMGLRRG